MITGFTAIPHKRNVKCEVCDKALTNADFISAKDRDYPVCQSLDCRRIMDQKSSMAPLFFKKHIEFNRKSIRNRRESKLAKTKHIQEITEKEHLEEEQAYQLALNEHIGLTKENTYLLVIPSGKPKSVIAPDERISKYTEHLQYIVRQGFKDKNETDDVNDEYDSAYIQRVISEKRLNNNPALRTVSDKLCTLCKGGCCSSGNDHAYLSVSTIRNVKDENPDLSAEEILGLYLSGISSVSIEGSCINHTLEGCTLPRHLRSNVCNGFYCEPLKSYQRDMSEQETLVNIIAVQRSSNYWSRLEPGVVNNIVSVSVVDEKDEHTQPELA